MAYSLKKFFLPDSATSLLAGFKQSLESMGSIIPETSVSDARARLSLAEAAGGGASVATPWYFDVQGVLYRTVGEKNASTGKWILSPVNEPQFWEGQYTGGETTNLAQFQFKPLISAAAIGQKPYARMVVCSGFAYGSVTKGKANLGLRIGSVSDQAEARFDAGDASAAAVMNMGIIPAGTDPVISLGVVGDHPSVSSSVYLGAAGKLTKLLVTAHPITMA